MRIVVGYLATANGEDGLNLGVLIARGLGAAIDICLVLPTEHTVPSRAPAEGTSDERLVQQAQAWLDEARAMVPGDIEVQTHLRHHPSLAQGLVEDATRLDAWAIVIGSAGEGLLGRHSLGTVSNGLLHASHVPIVLAPRGQRHSRADGIRQVTCAIGSEHDPDAVLRFAGRMCVQMHVPLRLVSLVSRPHHVLPLREAMAAADGDAPARATEAVAKARETVHAAVPELPPELVSTEIVDGPTPEAAIHKLDWHDGDLLIVGSGRLAAPRRLFLGSTAAKMLRVVPVPTVVVPNPEPNESE